MTYGEPIPKDVEVEEVKHFTQREIGEMLIKQVIDTLPYHAAGWGGHVSMTASDGRYDFTVYVWKGSTK